MNFEEETRDLQKRVMRYVEDSLDHKIPQCKAMLWTMKRFKDDLRRTNRKDSEFYLDWYELLKFYRWAKMFKHSKGVLTGQPIDLHVSQLFEATNIFCFKRRIDGLRRFREVYIQKARKNAKTQFLALVASYVAFLSEEQEEVYITGWTKTQSDLCYNEILYQIHRADMLEGKYSDSYHHISVNANGSTIKALSREARKKGDGTNPSLSIIDEYGTAHETNEIVDVQRSGMGARSEPLMIYITTAGFNLSFPAFRFYKYCKDIVNPDSDVENDQIFVAIYELDDNDNIKDESNWVKANPIVTTYKAGLDSLRSELKLALDQPERMRNFLTKNMDIWVDQKENGYLSMKKWKKQTVDQAFVDDFLVGASLYYGIDLSSTIDLTALGWVAVKNGKYLVGQHSYTPRDKFREKISKDNVRYDVFEERGELSVTPGSVVDVSELKSDLLEMATTYGVRQVGFDIWNATILAKELQDEGLEMVEVKQTISALSEATKKFRESVYDGKLYHADDQLLNWTMSNAIVQEDPNENIKINKSRSKDRVDPVDAILNAFSLAMYDENTIDLNEWILSDEWGF